MIQDDIIAKITDCARIEDVVSEFVMLKRRGANLIGLCPFHNERTPSFTVSPSKGRYKCFGCHASGDAVSFLMEHERMTFPEAIHYLAGKYQIEIPTHEGVGGVAVVDNTGCYAGAAFGASYFTGNLRGGIRYFAERGFTDATVQKFQLGFSDGEVGIIDAAKLGGVDMRLLQQSGLAIKKSDQLLPFFRARVMFPIHNLSGKVVAFAGRALSKEKNQPKYINSPETDIYVKSKILYGMYFAKKEIRTKDQCILVEGYTDVISLHQAGIENVVASSGTALTQDQIRLVKRHTNNITVLFDGDRAGIQAALRSINHLLSEGMNVMIVVLPDGEDPDSYVQKYGGGALTRYMSERAMDFVLFEARTLFQEAGDDVPKRAVAINAIVDTLNKIDDPIKRLMYLRECSHLLGIPEHLMKVKKAAVGGGGAAGVALPNEHPHEKALVRLLLEYGNERMPDGEGTIAEFVIQETQALPLATPVYAKIHEVFMRHCKGGLPMPTYDVFMMHEDGNVGVVAAALISAAFELSGRWHTTGIAAIGGSKIEIFDIVNRYKLAHIMRIIDETTASIQENPTVELLQRWQRLSVIKKQLIELLGVGSRLN